MRNPLTVSICFVIIFSFLLMIPITNAAWAKEPYITSDGFDYPLGKPDGIGYGVPTYALSFLEPYDYQRDGHPEYHPGEDWNDNDTRLDWGSDSDDAGDPVYVVSNGIVRYASYAGINWGYLVLIEHQAVPGEEFILPGGGRIATVWSLYGHLANIEPLVRRGQPVRRGQQLGTVGDYPHGTKSDYHLHFEIRIKYQEARSFVTNTRRGGTDEEPWPKSDVEEYYTHPSAFIRLNRPLYPLPQDYFFHFP